MTETLLPQLDSFEIEEKFVVKKQGYELTITQSAIFVALLKSPEGITRKELTEMVYGKGHPISSDSLNKIKSHLSHVRRFLLETRSPLIIESYNEGGSRLTAGWHIKKTK